MHEALVDAIVKHTRTRASEGDCPSVDASASEQLEQAVIALAADRDSLATILRTIIASDERGQGVGYAEAMNAGKAEIERLEKWT